MRKRPRVNGDVRSRRKFGRRAIPTKMFKEYCERLRSIYNNNNDNN